MTARGPSPSRGPSTSPLNASVDGSLLSPPDASALARFPERFGQRVLLTIDTEEEFDWQGPFQRDGYGLEHVGELARFQSFCEEIGAHPVYMVDWPITQAPRAVEVIGDAVARGAAELGMQLHPWVNPPFEEEANARNSFPGNLPPDLEAAKFHALKDRIETAFGSTPVAYRAGRYGVGPHTAALLSEAGIGVDTSVRTLFDYSAQGGPDFSEHPAAPYWAGPDSSVLELPITSTFWGILRQQGSALHRLQRHMPTFFAVFSRFRLLERIALTPEGVLAEEAIRGIDIALDDQLPLLVLSLHSPSLAPGFTPYAADEAGVEAIYDWLRVVYAYLRQRGVENARVGDTLAAARAGRAVGSGHQ